MSDNLNNQNCERQINEAVCIDTKRIYDSCVSKDCLEDLRVTFCADQQDIIDAAKSIKCCCCEVSAVTMDVEEVPFNRGFYSVTNKLYFKLKFECCTSAYEPVKFAVGYATFEKKCILYGGEGTSKVFTARNISSSCGGVGTCDGNCLSGSVPSFPTMTNPIAKLRTVEPVVLECTVQNVAECVVPFDVTIPTDVLCSDSGVPTDPKKAVLVSLGMFSIIQLERETQILVPIYDYCIPDNECCCSTQDPCETFQKIDFPIDDFFPNKKDDSKGCECQDCCENDAE